MVESRNASPFARSSSRTGGSPADVDRQRLQREVEHLRSENERGKRERNRLEREHRASEQARRRLEAELAALRFRDEMRGWYLAVVLPLTGLVLVIAAMRR